MKQLKYRGQTIVTQDEFLIRDESELPATAEPGSLAYTADMTLMYMMDEDGTWQEVGGGES